MRLIIITAVDHRTHGVDLLEHGAGKSLAERRTCKLCRSHSIRGMDDTASLVGKIDTRSRSEIKKTLGFDELIRAHGRRDLHHTVITGIGDNFPWTLGSMSAGPHRTFDVGLAVGSEGLSAVALKSIVL